MKRFIIHSSFFFIVSFVLALIPDIIITNKIKHFAYNDYSVWDKILSGKMDNDLLIIGSSRAFHHYNPIILDSILNTNCYNLGRDGKNLDISIFIYNLYIKHNPKPKTILCDIFYGSMNKSNLYAREQFYPYLFNKEIYNNIKENQQLSMIDKYVPLIKYRGILKDVIKHSLIKDTTYKGYYGCDISYNKNNEDIPNTIPYAHDPTVFKMIEKWLQQCQEDSVNVIFIHSPIYIEATNKIEDTAAMWTMYRNIANKYKIPILDYTRDSICFDTNYFYGALHLNRKGSELFTQRLAYELESLGYK
ncbi:MAG: hypothetical protein IJK07_06055 [Bacteroidales bacterium]|nr:hypothetical protein [Bacteroidales bacterium]